MGVPKGRQTDWTDDRKAFVKDLWGRGFSASQIADELNESTPIGHRVSRNAVIGITTRNGYSQPFKIKVDKPEKTPRRRRKTRAERRLNFDAPNLAPIAFELSDEPAEFLGITFAELQDGDGRCRFPRGETSPYLFCGQPQQRESSYCPSCRRITVQNRISQADRETRIRNYHRKKLVRQLLNQMGATA